MSPAEHPLSAAIKALVAALGAELVTPDEAGPEDVVLDWEAEPVVAVRLPGLTSALDRLLADAEHRHGPLAALDREAKQRVVRTLEQRGAFTIRRGVETVAAALGVSRFTVYNHLNRETRG
ncbi:helix-turn-helix domain-containing protein [Embleya sp. NPDC050493]|uniref:helix-turn-helix domain-containing protein n=1 Tax=Embleya sp. NPDC050493 TaxID=3363989 RepID=UPI00379A7E82